MTPDELKQAADELVGMFTKIIWESGNTVSKPMIIDVCIAHCKLVIEVLEKLRPTLAVISFSYIEQLNTHRLILSELEGRVK
jgi:hypothetical protein